MDIIREAKKFALEEIEKYGFPVKSSFEISELKALELAEKLNANKMIILVGVYLMDIKLGEAWNEGKPEEHVEKGVIITKQFLVKFDLDEETKNKIINCVEAHHGQRPFICKEAEICANADCYRFLHPQSFLKILIERGKKQKFEELLKFLEQKLDEKHKLLSLNICKQELENNYHLLKELIKSAREL